MTYPCILCGFNDRIGGGEAARCINTERPLTHPLDHSERQAGMKATCTAEDCNRSQYARGWCEMHYQRWRKHGTIEKSEPGRACSVDGCDKPVLARDWCSMHWCRWRKHGDPLKGARPSLAERLAAGLVRTESGCLEWTGSRNHGGYGQIGGAGHMLTTHRVAWALAHPGEPMPSEVRHTCDNPPCCDPGHLLAGTVVDNARDRIERGRQWVKVSTKQVAAIRAEWAGGSTTQTALGIKYGIHGSQVSRIVNGVYRVVT